MNFKRRSTVNILMSSQKSMKKGKPWEPPSPRERALTSNSGPRLRRRLRKWSGATPSNLLGNLLPMSSMSHSNLIDGGEERDKDIQTCKIAVTSFTPFLGKLREAVVPHQRGVGQGSPCCGVPHQAVGEPSQGAGQSPDKSVAPGQCQGHCCEADLESGPSLQGGAKKTETCPLA